jgi:hypothetical protein
LAGAAAGFSRLRQDLGKGGGWRGCFWPLSGRFGGVLGWGWGLVGVGCFGGWKGCFWPLSGRFGGLRLLSRLQGDRGGERKKHSRKKNFQKDKNFEIFT